MSKGRLVGWGSVLAVGVFLAVFGPAPASSSSTDTVVVTAFTSPDSIDPQVAAMSMSWQLLVNAYDGLLTFRKAGGRAGTEVVPNLATAMPVVTDGGRRYAFRIHQGVRFAPPVGREVRASDVAATFGRIAAMKTPGAEMLYAVDGFRAAYGGAPGPIRGIRADDAAGTVTFQLTRPDANFRYALALPFTSIVPAGTPAADQSQLRPIPGTGPYAFTRHDPSQRIELARNPAFRQWSPNTPAGRSDRIRVELGVSEENAATRIMRGRADLALTMIPKTLMPMLRASDEWSPYLHEHELSRTSYIWMNLEEPPFDRVEVRRAVNLAIDRRAIGKLNGGAGTPSSTILPPLIAAGPQQEAYPRRDLEQARRLVRASGVDLGAPIVLWFYLTPPYPSFAQYLQGVLGELGFTDVRTRGVDQSAYYDIIGAGRTNAQIGFASWSGDFPDGATFIDANLNGGRINERRTDNFARYRGADREIARIGAIADPRARAAAWQRLDGEIMERDAPWAPMYHSVQRNLLSQRAGNYVFHPVFDVLLSQLTVDGSGTNNAEMHDGERRPR